MRSNTLHFLSVIPQNTDPNASGSDTASIVWLRDTYPPILARTRSVEAIELAFAGIIGNSFGHYAVEATGRQLVSIGARS